MSQINTNLLSILIVEDNPGDLFLLEETIRLTKIPVHKIYRATSASGAIKVLNENIISIVLLDLSLPDSAGFNSFIHINEYASAIPIIVLTGLSDMDLALETMANGAQDYLIKGEFDERLLLKSIQYSIERHRIRESLLQSNESYRNLFFNNPLPIFIWDLNTLQILEVNDVAYEEYGYTRDELLNMSVLDLRNESEFGKVRDCAKIFRETDLIKKTSVWTNIKKGGEPMIMEISSHKIDYKGNLAILAIHNNITETIQLQKKLEEEKITKQKEINEAIIKVQETERNEISTELHDNVNQQLTVAMMYIASAQQKFPENAELLKQSSGFILNAIEEIRKLSQILVTPLIKHFGLSKAIEGLLDDITIINTFQIDFRADTFFEEDIPYEFKLSIFRIVQAQMSNIIKYSKAQNVNITLGRDTDFVYLDIVDDGIGFDLAQPRKGIGLHNIMSRADVYNGVVGIQSSPGNGCVVNIKIPKKIVLQSFD